MVCVGCVGGILNKQSSNIAGYSPKWYGLLPVAVLTFKGGLTLTKVVPLPRYCLQMFAV